MGKFNRASVDKTNQHQRVHKMLHMEEKTSIILSHRREGMSIREIARRNGMSRKTVRKYLREFEKEPGPAYDPEEERLAWELSHPKKKKPKRGIKR